MAVLDEDMLSLSVLMNQFKSEGKNISALKSDAEFQNFAFNAISNCIDRLPMNEPQTIEVTCNMVEGSDGNLYWAPSDSTMLEKFLTPSFVIDSDLGEADVNEFLNALSSYGSSTTAPVAPVNPIEQPSVDTPITPPPVEPNNGTYNPNDTWLIQLYMCGTDLESGSKGDSIGAATTDIQEIMNVNLPPNVKVLIQTGGTQKWQRSDIPNNAIGRYLYDSNGWQALPTNPDASMGDSKTLENFIRYGKDNFNADHKVIIFWDHGITGLVGICIDENHGGDYLNLSKINAAFKNVYGSPQTPPFEIIGFDTCLSCAYEYANAINGMARYMVASENSEPNPGWYYTGWLKALSKNPAMNGRTLGEVMCDEFMIGVKQYDQRRGSNNIAKSTLSVVDMSKMPQLRAAVENFGQEAFRLAQKNPQAFYSSFGVAALQAENYNEYNPKERRIDPCNVVDFTSTAGSAEI